MENKQKKTENVKGLEEHIRKILPNENPKTIRVCETSKGKGIVVQPTSYRARLMLLDDGEYAILGNTPGFEKMAYGMMEMLGLNYQEENKTKGQITGSYTRKTG